MKRIMKISAITLITAVVYSPSALATNYPAIKPKGPKASETSLNIFGWIVNNFPWVLLGIVVILFAFAIIRSSRERVRYQQAVERNNRIRSMEEEARRNSFHGDMESYRHTMFVRQQRALMTDSLRYDILKRDGFRCKICGATAADGVKLHVDHIVPVSKGGRTDPQNLRTLCERCNMGKGAKLE